MTNSRLDCRQVSGFELERNQLPVFILFSREQQPSGNQIQVLKFFSTDVVIGRPFVTSPGVPADRVALLRKAFDDTMKDPAFVQDSVTAGLDLNPVAGERIQKIVADLIATPDNIVTRAKLAMEAKDITERSR